MEHPDLVWRMCQSNIAEKQRRAAMHNDTGIAWATRKTLGHALIALGTRLTPASPESAHQPLKLPMPAAPSLKT